MSIPSSVVEGFRTQEFSGPYTLRVDVDSYYLLFGTMKECFYGFGEGVTYAVNSLKRHTDSTDSSRFALDLSDAAAPSVNVAGFNPKKVGLNYIPNIHLCDVQIPGISTRCKIFMYFIGARNVSKTPYVTYLQLKATVLLLNIAVSIVTGT